MNPKLLPWMVSKGFQILKTPVSLIGAKNKSALSLMTTKPISPEQRKEELKKMVRSTMFDEPADIVISTIRRRKSSAYRLAQGIKKFGGI